jgi:L-ascorbate metabolism protein UlaG (beta-lactamase superfamily)
MTLVDVRLTHIGGPTVLIEAVDWRLLADPTFDPPGQSNHFGWGTGSRKLTGPAIAASDLGHIDAVLLSHDNLDAAGRQVLPAAQDVIVTRPGQDASGATPGVSSHGRARGWRPRDGLRSRSPPRRVAMALR